MLIFSFDVDKVNYLESNSQARIHIELPHKTTAHYYAVAVVATKGLATA